MNFIGYTYKADFENQRSELISALEALEREKSLFPKQKFFTPILQENDVLNETTLRTKSKSPFSKCGNLQKALNCMGQKEKPMVGKENVPANTNMRAFGANYKYLSNKNMGLAQKSLWKMNG